MLFIIVFSIILIWYYLRKKMNNMLEKNYEAYMYYIPQAFWDVPKLTLKSLEKTMFWKLLKHDGLNVNDLLTKMKNDKEYIGKFLIEQKFMSFINLLMLDNVIMYGKSANYYLRLNNIKLIKLYEEYNEETLLECKKFISNNMFQYNFMSTFNHNPHAHGIRVSIDDKVNLEDRVKCLVGVKYKYVKEVILPNDSIVQFCRQSGVSYMDVRCTKIFMKKKCIKIEEYVTSL